MGYLKIFLVNSKKPKETDKLPKWFLVLHFAAKNHESGSVLTFLLVISLSVVYSIFLVVLPKIPNQ